MHKHVFMCIQTSNSNVSFDVTKHSSAHCALHSTFQIKTYSVLTRYFSQFNGFIAILQWFTQQRKQ